MAVALAAPHARFLLVKLSVKSDYAARALLSLARQYEAGRSVKADEMAAEQGIPANYLVQILIELKAKQLVRSVRGKQGGYLLARPPAEITLADVLRAVHGEVFDSPALSDRKCPPELRDAWQRLQESVESAAGALTFQQLVERGPFPPIAERSGHPPRIRRFPEAAARHRAAREDTCGRLGRENRTLRRAPPAARQPR